VFLSYLIELGVMRQTRSAQSIEQTLERVKERAERQE
jgi:hypothetical protein